MIAEEAAKYVQQQLARDIWDLLDQEEASTVLAPEFIQKVSMSYFALDSDSDVEDIVMTFTVNTQEDNEEMSRASAWGGGSAMTTQSTRDKLTASEAQQALTVIAPSRTIQKRSRRTLSRHTIPSPPKTSGSYGSSDASISSSSYHRTHPPPIPTTEHTPLVESLSVESLSVESDTQTSLSQAPSDDLSDMNETAIPPPPTSPPTTPPSLAKRRNNTRTTLHEQANRSPTALKFEAVVNG